MLNLSSLATVPYVSTLFVLLYLLLIFFISLSMAMTKASPDAMTRTPPKNDPSLSFPIAGEGRRLCWYTLFRSLAPAVYSQLIYLISFGEMMAAQESPLLQSKCHMLADGDGAGMAPWTKVIQCNDLENYDGKVRATAGAFMMAELALSAILSSSTFIYRTQSLWDVRPWRHNRAWVRTSFASLLILAVFLVLTTERDDFRLPWYFFLLLVTFPLLNLVVHEMVKKSESWHVNRFVMFRRLQFDTRLGQWSPK